MPGQAESLCGEPDTPSTSPPEIDVGSPAPRRRPRLTQPPVGRLLAQAALCGHAPPQTRLVSNARLT